jgi:hypothetical protein
MSHHILRGFKHGKALGREGGLVARGAVPPQSGISDFRLEISKANDIGSLRFQIRDFKGQP